MLHRHLVRPRRQILALGLASAFALSSNGFSKEPIAAAETSSLWDLSLLAGFSLTDGNSDTLGVHAGLKGERIRATDETYFGANVLYSEDSGATTDESVSAFAQYNHLLSDRAYLGLVGNFLYDDIAAIDYRLTVGPTLGYYLIKNDRTKLALEAGAGYQWEDVGGTKSDYWTLRFAERLTHQLSDNLSLFQSVTFSPEINDFDNYTIDAQAGIETRMSDRLSLRIFAQNRYDSTPAAGLESNDFGVFSGLSLALGPVEPIASSPGAKGSVVSIVGSEWDVDLGVGFSLTDGNSDTLGVNADLTATKITDANEIFLGAGAAYGETGGVTNQERAYAFGQRNTMLSDRHYLGARVDFLYDDINALDYRVTPALLLGYYAIKNETTKLALEVGPSFTWEDQAGVSNEYFGVSFGERFSHQLSDRVAIYQSAGLVLDVDNTDNWVVNAAAGLDVKVGERLTLRTEVEDIYDNEPGAGLEENDVRVTSSLVWSF